MNKDNIHQASQEDAEAKAAAKNEISKELESEEFHEIEFLKEIDFNFIQWMEQILTTPGKKLLTDINSLSDFHTYSLPENLTTSQQFFATENNLNYFRASRFGEMSDNIRQSYNWYKINYEEGTEPQYINSFSYKALNAHDFSKVYYFLSSKENDTDNEGQYTNIAPTATSDSFRLDQGTFSSFNVLSNDWDADAGILRLMSASKTSHGTVEFQHNGMLVYTPDEDFNGIDSFKYTLSDGQGGSSQALVSITVDPVIYLNPGDDLQAIVDVNPEGMKFVFRSGTYHNAVITPKDGQHFVGEDGVIFDGSINIDDWTLSDGYWTARGFPAPSYSHGPGRDGMAQYVEDLYIDGTAYVRVATKDEVGMGEFYYEDGEVFIVNDPQGKDTIALKNREAFIGGDTENVTIANITFNHYASMAQHGAIEAPDTLNWTLINVTAEYNHGAGVRAGEGMTIIGGSFSHNGQVGIHAIEADGLTIDGVVAIGNNYAGFDSGWDAGGAKILTSHNVTVTNSEFANNYGRGLWFDWENQNILIEGNYIHHNKDNGLQYEASYNATIKNNVIELNNYDGFLVGYWGSEIIMNNSSNVEVIGNHVVSEYGQGIGMVYDSRGEGSNGPLLTIDNIVHHNTIVMINAGQNGLAISADQELMPIDRFLWNNNHYVAADANDLQFTWDDQWFTAPWISDHPIETDGSFTYVGSLEDYILGQALTRDNTYLLDGTTHEWESTDDRTDYYKITDLDEAEYIIRDINFEEGDIIDLSQILTEYDPLDDILSDFITLTQNNADHIISVDTDGGTDDFVPIIQLQNSFGDIDLEALINNNNIFI